VLILPPGHAKAIDARRRFSSRERWMVGGAVTAVVAILVAVVIALAAGGRTSSHGCIYATVPAATGAQEVSQCGAAAVSTCMSVRAQGAYTQQAARVIAVQCRKAGLPVGP
jgi:hypothetical protein